VRHDLADANLPRSTTGVRTPEPESLRRAYEEACRSYHEIAGFRAKLLGLLPLASGAGVFLLLEEGTAGQSRHFLGPIGLFGAVVTIGLFLYELRGIQRCHQLENQAATLERRLALGTQEGQFLGQPKRGGAGFVGPPGAAGMVYLAVVLAWLYVAGYGFEWWESRPPTWALASATAVYVVPQAVYWSWCVIKQNRKSGAAEARAWEHTALAVADLSQAIAFYEEAFGYKRLTEPEENTLNEEMRSMLGTASVECDLAQLRSPISEHVLELIAFRKALVDGEQLEPTQPGSGHVSFAVSELEAAVAAVKRCGATTLGGITRFPDGSSRVYCRDPAGTVIELAGPDRESTPSSRFM
jgi:predicted enzyme related to lactoylglutathione lyase